MSSKLRFLSLERNRLFLSSESVVSLDKPHACFGRFSNVKPEEINVLSQLLDQYEHEKVSIIGDLAQIYWLRVVIFTLSKGTTDVVWADLINYRCGVDLNCKERLCMKLVKEEHPDIRAELVPQVHSFIHNYSVSLMRPTIDSNEDAKVLVQKVRSFEFVEGDPHKQLALDLCAVIEFHLYYFLLPTSELVRFYLQYGYEPGEDFAPNIDPYDDPADHVIHARFMEKWSKHPR